MLSTVLLVLLYTVDAVVQSSTISTVQQYFFSVSTLYGTVLHRTEDGKGLEMQKQTFHPTAAALELDKK